MAVKKNEEEQTGLKSRLDSITDKILNREKFSYDLNGDAFYNQYKDKFVQQGKMAMMDTMGQAAGLTGGYGNSYAQQVGQQTYQGYLQNLNDVVPELYQLALDSYNREGDNMMNQYNLLADREAQEYARKQDAIAQQQWQAQFDEDKRRYDLDYTLSLLRAQAKAEDEDDDDGGEDDEDNTPSRFASTGVLIDDGTSAPVRKAEGTFTPISGTQEHSLETFGQVDTPATDSFKGSVMTRRELSRTGGQYGSYEDYLETKIDEWLNSGKLTDSEAASLMLYYGLV